MTFRALALAALVSLCVATTEAAFTASYSFANKTGAEASDPLTNLSGDQAVSFGALARSTDLATSTGANSIAASGFGSSFAVGSGYFSFTVTPGAATRLQLLQIAFYVRVSGTGPMTIDLRSSLDNYATTLGTQAVTTTVTTAPILDTVALGSAFGNLTGAVTFRIYGYGASSTAGTLRITDSTGTATATAATVPGLQITGNVTASPNAVPEPASMVLLGLGLVGSVLIGRRQPIR